MVLQAVGRRPAGRDAPRHRQRSGPVRPRLCAQTVRTCRSAASSTAREGVDAANEAAQREGIGARFFERNLLEPVTLADGSRRRPTRSARRCSSTSTTRPGWCASRWRCSRPAPRSWSPCPAAHARRSTSTSATTGISPGPTLQDVLTSAGLDVDVVYGTGFPFFNLYKLAVMARGEKLVLRCRSARRAPPRPGWRPCAGGSSAGVQDQPRRRATRLADRGAGPRAARKGRS